MLSKNLISGLNITQNNEIQDKNIENIEIQKVTDIIQNIIPNSLFVCIKGMRFNVYEHIQEIITKGAVIIIHDEDIDSNIIKSNSNITFIKVDNSRKALAILASNWFGNPQSKLKCIGITGTNGKTSTSEILYQILDNLGKKIGLISTIQAKTNQILFDTGFHTTTPEPLELHYYLKQMLDSGIEYVIIETTSHAIAHYRTYGIEFEVAAITNITPEHLDFHKTFENYLNTKAKIQEQSKIVILNKYDPSFELLKQSIKNYEIALDYKELSINPEFIDNFPGEYNLQNLSMAFSITQKLFSDNSPEFLEKLLSINLTSISGRFEFILNEKLNKIVVDFAHDATSLESVLNVAKSITSTTKGKLILIFGCAGLRDIEKRKKMGIIAGKLADKFVITAEDPRTEKVEDIISEIQSGVLETGRILDKDYYIIQDRGEAIKFAIDNLMSKDNGDLLLVTGKGHERSMCFGTTEIPWSDQEFIRTVLKNGVNK